MVTRASSADSFAKMKFFTCNSSKKSAFPEDVGVTARPFKIVCKGGSGVVVKRVTGIDAIVVQYYYSSRAPRCGSGPNCRLEAPPPKAIGGAFLPATALPSPPSFSSPTPLALSCNALEGAAWAGEGEVAHRGGEGALQAALGARPTSGGHSI